MTTKEGGLRGSIRNIGVEVAAIPDSGVSRWTFDDADTDSGTATDVWGDNDGTINGATTGVSGANQTYTTNEAYSFDGTDDNVTVTIGNSYSTFSVALWYYLDSSSSNECLFSIGNESGEVTFRVDSGNGYDLFDDGVTNGGGGGEGSWIHVCLTVDTTSSDFEIYENGSSIITGSFNVDFGSGDLYFGERNPVDDGGDNLSGDLDDIRLYDKVLSSNEVSNLYNNGSIGGGGTDGATYTLTEQSEYFATTTEKTAAVYDSDANEVLLVGGWNNRSTVLDDIQVWNPDTSSTSTPFSLPAARRNHGAIYRSADRSLYTFGGWGAEDTIQRVNLTDGSSETLSTTLPGNRFDPSAEYIPSEDATYILGGASGSDGYTAHDDIYKFDHNDNSITTLSETLNEAGWGMPSATDGSEIYLFGGERTSTNVDIIQQFDVSTGSVSTMAATVPNGFYCHDADSPAIYDPVNDWYWNAGGRNEDASTYVDDIWYYDANADSVTVISETLPLATDDFSGVWVPNDGPVWLGIGGPNGVAEEDGDGIQVLEGVVD